MNRCTFSWLLILGLISLNVEANAQELTEIWSRTTKVAKDTPPSESRNELHRFVGFVEGKTGLNPPTFWESAILGLRRNDLPHVSISEDIYQWPYHMSGGIQVPRDTQIEINYESILIVSNGQKIEIFSKPIIREIQNTGALSYCHHTSCHFVALHSNRSQAYSIYCLDSETHKKTWKTEIKPMQTNMHYEGLGFHHVQLVVSNESLFVFGTCDDVIYLHEIEAKSGRKSHSFSSSVHQ